MWHCAPHGAPHCTGTLLCYISLLYGWWSIDDNLVGPLLLHSITEDNTVSAPLPSFKRPLLQVLVNALLLKDKIVDSQLSMATGQTSKGFYCTSDHWPLSTYAEQLFVENLSQTAFIVGAHLNCMSNIVQVLGAVLQSVWQVGTEERAVGDVPIGTLPYCWYLLTFSRDRNLHLCSGVLCFGWRTSLWRAPFLAQCYIHIEKRNQLSLTFVGTLGVWLKTTPHAMYDLLSPWYWSTPS